MNSDITVYNYDKPKTFFLGKISKIINEITEATSAVSVARNRVTQARNEYENTSGIHFFRKSKLKKEYQRAMDDLTIANSEVIIQILKIMGYTIELIPLCFCLTMDLIQGIVLWVANGFSERDKRFASFAKKTIPLFEQNKRPQKSGINISKGLSRLFRVCIVVAIIIFGFQKIWMHNKNTATTTTTTTSQVTSAENIEALKNRMVELKSSINTLKENFFGSSDTDEEIYFEAIDQDDNPESKNELSSEEIANTEVNQTTPENLEQKTVADENKTETADTNSQTEASAEPSGQTNNE